MILGCIFGFIKDVSVGLTLMLMSFRGLHPLVLIAFLDVVESFLDVLENLVFAVPWSTWSSFGSSSKMINLIDSLKL